MIWPTIIVDNFFDEPEKIIEYSQKLKFGPDTDGQWPGVRTGLMGNLDDKFFNYINYKIVRLIYPMNHLQMSWKSNQYFQKINGNIFKNEGWVHSDSPAEFTAIIYLSKHKNCGTSLYDKKHLFNASINDKEKREAYKNLNFKNEMKYLKQNNDLFEKNLTVDSKFNRLVIFDSNQYHAADKFKDEKNDEERLTLITFFYELSAESIKYPVPEMRRQF
jgi:hypothetical protein